MNEMTIDDTRQMLADSARSYVARTYDAKARAVSLAHAQGCSPQRWQDFADMGWLALPLAEQDGGLGGSLADICTVAEELGAGLVVEPFVACAVLGAGLLADLGDDALRQTWLPALAQGTRRIAFAAWEPGNGFDPAAINTVAHRDGPRFRLDGEKALVLGGDGADAYLLAARLQGEDAVGIFLLGADTPGLSITPQALYDGQHTACLSMHQAVAGDVLLIASPEEVNARLEHTLHRARVAHGAETVGAMQRAFDITLEYLKTRKQFGRVISTNQVVQHRLVDLYVEIEEARAMTQAAAAELDAGGAHPTHAHMRHCAAARVCVAKTARHVWEESVQLHGAIGMTQEYILGQYVKQLALAGNLYGGVEEHLERLAAATLGHPAASAS